MEIFAPLADILRYRRVNMTRSICRDWRPLPMTSAPSPPQPSRSPVSFQLARAMLCCLRPMLLVLACPTHPVVVKLAAHKSAAEHKFQLKASTSELHCGMATTRPLLTCAALVAQLHEMIDDAKRRMLLAYPQLNTFQVRQAQAMSHFTSAGAQRAGRRD